MQRALNVTQMSQIVLMIQQEYANLDTFHLMALEWHARYVRQVLRRELVMKLSVLPALQILTQPQKDSLYALLVLLLLQAAAEIVLEFAMRVTSVTARYARSAQRVPLKAQVTQVFVLHALRVSIRLQSERQHVSTAIPTRLHVVEPVLVCAKRDISPPLGMAYLARRAH